MTRRLLSLALGGALLLAGDEVGMKVREEDVLDRETMLGSEREVLINIALRVNDRGGVRPLVADEV